MSSGYEKRDVSVKGIVKGSIFLVALIVAMVVFVRDYFVYSMEKAVTEAAVNYPSRELLEIRASENELLDHFRIIDKEKGIFQIPIALAMELVVEDYKN